MQWNRSTKILGIAGMVALAGALAVSQAAVRHAHMRMGGGFGPSPEHIVAFLTDTLDLTTPNRRKPRRFSTRKARLSDAHAANGRRPQANANSRREPNIR